MAARAMTTKSKSQSRSHQTPSTSPPASEGTATGSHPGREPTPEASRIFGRYRLLARIGEGGMAEVYRAVIQGPEGFEKELVLKRILPRLSNTGDFKTMFIREAKISALLLHPNIVQIYDFGEAEGAYFIAMESVQGVTLRETLNTLRKEQRSMPFMIAADITRQMCIGLDYAHALNGPDGVPLEIVHQDISPTNLMLAFNGTVKILDFGIARAASFAEEEAKKGLIKGKVSYLSPEQIHVKPFDARADIFAVGVVFHEMLTGHRLFQARNDITRMRQLLAQPIQPPSAINASIPRELDRIVLRALEIDPKARYQSAAEMAADLERTLIAARYSSRELSKLLQDLYMPSDDPVVVVEEDPEHHTHTATATGIGTGPGTVSRSGTPAGAAQGDRTTANSWRAEHESAAIGGALRAERARLQRTRWKGRAKIAALAVAVGAAAGGIALLAKRWAPLAVEVLKPPPPPPVTPNQIAAQPRPEPPPPTKAVKKKGKKKAKAAAAETEAGTGETPAPAAGSEPP
jgi:serine/threonine-protein kinase